MQTERSNDIYNPLETSKFIVNFELDFREQTLRAERVITHLSTLDQEALIDESIKFFKWIILFNIALCNKRYADLLLRFFHECGLLLHKKQVNVPQKLSSFQIEIFCFISEIDFFFSTVFYTRYLFKYFMIL